MCTPPLKKFSSQISPEVLEALKEVASREGRKLHALLDEAFRDYIIKKGALLPRE